MDTDRYNRGVIVAQKRADQLNTPMVLTILLETPTSGESWMIAGPEFYFAAGEPRAASAAIECAGYDADLIVNSNLYATPEAWGALQHGIAATYLPADYFA